MSTAVWAPSPYAKTDCHKPGGCGCNTSVPNARQFAKAAEQVLERVVAFGETRGWSRKDVFFAAPGHENDRGFSIAMEGDYEWPLHLPQEVRAFAADKGIYIEVGAGWRLDLYWEGFS
jgi:hypothetical protein